MTKRNFILVLSAFLFLFSCKKKTENQDSVAESTTNLPNYGNVDLAKVFTPAEIRLPIRLHWQIISTVITRKFGKTVI
jgi:hypothetical protein